MKIELHIKIDTPGQTAIDALSSQDSGLSRQAIKQAMSRGAVWLGRDQHTQRLRRADRALKSGDLVHLYYDEDVLSRQPEPATLISDEGSYSIWYKPYGMFSQGSKWGDHCTINRWAEKHLQPQRPAFIVHRLDRAASGLIIIAHQKKITARLAELFQQRKIKKHYCAIVHGRLSEQLSLDTPIDDKPAISHIKPLAYDASHQRSLVEVRIDTGRKHQIRKHLSGAGFAIVGDRLYGHGDAQEDLCLRSSYLSFISPDDGLEKHYRLNDELALTL